MTPGTLTLPPSAFEYAKVYNDPCDCPTPNWWLDKGMLGELLIICKRCGTFFRPTEYEETYYCWTRLFRVAATGPHARRCYVASEVCRIQIGPDPLVGKLGIRRASCGHCGNTIFAVGRHWWHFSDKSRRVETSICVKCGCHSWRPV